MTRCKLITFASISDCYTIKFRKNTCETKKECETWKVNLNIENGITIWHIWIVYPSKMSVYSFISDRHTIKFKEPIYEIEIQNDSET